MNPSISSVLFTVIFLAACGGKQQKKEDGDTRPGHVLKETIATGEKGLVKISSFRKRDFTENLCQQWEFGNGEGASSTELTMDENFDPIHPQYNFFKDGAVLENPRHHLRMGKWRIGGRDSLILNFTDSVQRWFIITSIDSKELRLVTKNKAGKALYLNLRGNGLIHQNMYNDPFHPVNNQWRVQPAVGETDAEIKKRVVNCIKFFALFYRDNLLRNLSSIDFEGFPRIFNWYRGGLGIPDRDKVDKSWIDCFYDEEEAMKGYKFLRMLIVDYEYDWPEKVEWYLQTHSVLEQMYHKAEKM
jgi:hypothetical protein